MLDVYGCWLLIHFIFESLIESILLKSFPEAKDKTLRQSIKFFTWNQSSGLCVGILVSWEVSLGPAVKVDHLDLFSLASLASQATRHQEPNIEKQTGGVQSSHLDSWLSSPVYSICSLVSNVILAKLSEGKTQLVQLSVLGPVFLSALYNYYA